MTRFGCLLLAIMALCGAATSALAHPHIFIDAKVRIVVDAEGRLTSIHNSWTFDEALSAWQTQGLDADGDGRVTSKEMQALADENLAGLAEYGFYTSAGNEQESISFRGVGDQTFTFVGNRTTLDFTIVPVSPYVLRAPVEIAVADPEYYVAITVAEGSVALDTALPGCAVSMVPGRELPEDIAARLYDLPPDLTRLPPDLEQAVRGVQGAIRLTCPPGAAATAPTAPAAAPVTALDAVTDLAEAKPALPFGGPPPEPGFNLPATGFLGWIRDMQEQFYLALGTTIDRVKQDGSAFWLLGGLSFLYGIFHAAGPGHGKVVIGSYMLANERQVRRGILLSVLAALLQSVTALVFVGVAAALLGLSALAMNEAVVSLDIVSYALIAGLGLWLIVRRLFGLGHSHAPPPPVRTALAHAHPAPARHALNAGRQGLGFSLPRAGEARVGVDAFGRSPGHPHYGHDHGDDDATDHHHHHHHVVTADQASGDWREQLGVVVSVGIRPCTGALMVFFFSLSQGLVAAGIAAVFMMGVGTALTVSILAALAVYAKSVARRALGLGSALAARVLWWTELAGGVAVLVFGATLLVAALI